MSQKSNTVEPVVNSYDKTTLFKPDKLVINYGEKHSLLMNDSSNSYYYTRMLNASNALLKEMFSIKYPYYSKGISVEEWDKLTDGRCVQLKYEKNIKANALTGLLGIKQELLNGIENINDIIISFDSDKIYIADMQNKLYYEFSNNTVSFSKLDSLMTEVNNQTLVPVIFLNKLSPEAAPDFIMPAQTFTDAKELPVYSVANELDPDGKNDFVSKFFAENSTPSIIKDSEGAKTYNDREGATVKINKDGSLEYVRYNLSTQDAPKVSPEEALSISSDFVSSHLGFPEDSYLTGIQSNTIGTRYLITYNYRQEGKPVLLDTEKGSNAIEIELVGREVKRYKRQVLIPAEAKPMTELKAPTTILDAVFRESTLSNENIIQMNNMRIVYVTRETQNKLSLIPAWIIDVVTSRTDSGIELHENRQYVINAGTGFVIGK